MDKEDLSFSVQADCIEVAPPWRTVSKYSERAEWRRDSAGERAMKER